MKEWGPFPLRIGLGLIFITWGLYNVCPLFSGTGLEVLSKNIASIGLTPGNLWAYVLSYIYIISGILLLLGLFIQVVASVLALLIIFLTFKINFPNGFFVGNNGIEYNLLIICALLSLAFSGAGRFIVTAKN